MSLIDTAADLLSTASGITELLPMKTRKFCQSPMQEAVDYFRAFNDIAAGAGTVAQVADHETSSLVDQLTSSIASTHSTPSEAWTNIPSSAASSPSHVNLIGKYIV